PERQSPSSPSRRRGALTAPHAAQPARLATPRVLEGLGIVAIAAAGLAMLARTWRTWPDPLIDFGREIYVPWRLAAGDVLYRDAAYFTCPVAPYGNALWVRLFGASLMTLVAANLLLLSALTALLYALLRDIGSRVGATAACLVFMALFAFGEFLVVGNYNFVT